MHFLVLTIIGCAFLLAVSATPGMFSSGLLCPCFSLLLLAGVAVVWTTFGLLTVSAPGTPRRQKRFACVAGGVVILSAILCFACVPSRVVLWAVRGEFEALLEKAPRKYGGDRLGRWVGCFYVDEYGADEEGGVYFRTASHADGIGPDTMSYGFAYRPHRESCPFGFSKYSAFWLFGDWYWFSVSND